MKIFQQPATPGDRPRYGVRSSALAILNVVFLRGLLQKATANNLAKPGGERVSDAVEGALAVFAALKDPGLHQEAQMFGDVGLRGAGEFHDFADVPWGIADGLENAQACGFAEDLKHGGDLEELLRGEGRRLSGLTHKNITI